MSWPRSSTTPPSPSSASTTHARSSAPRRTSGRSATTTSSWSRTAPTGGPTAPRRPRPLSARARRAPAARAVPAVRHRRGWSWWLAGSIHRSVARRRGRLPAATGDATARPSGRRGGAARGPPRQVRGEGLDEGGGAGTRSPTRPSVAASALVAPTCPPPASSTSWSSTRATPSLSGSPSPGES